MSQMALTLESGRHFPSAVALEKRTKERTAHGVCLLLLRQSECHWACAAGCHVRISGHCDNFHSPAETAGVQNYQRPALLLGNAPVISCENGSRLSKGGSLLRMASISGTQGCVHEESQFEARKFRVRKLENADAIHFLTPNFLA